MTPLLNVQNLSVQFKTPNGRFDAVKNVSFSLEKGKTLALVGESGSGKSVTALSVLQLLPYPLASHPTGTIHFDGQSIIGAAPSVLQSIRGKRISMIFQEPLTALNPLHTIERQIGEILKLHQSLDRQQIRARILELMDMVELDNLTNRLNAYPHELSGGQRQRVMIAMALANNPDLLIADEPTTALDVTIQAQILELLKSLQVKLGMALMMITHDLKIVEKMADDVCVMKHGNIVERQQSRQLFSAPQHDYTKALLSAQPTSHHKPVNENAPIVMEGRDIKVHFESKKNLFGNAGHVVKAVDGISLKIPKGQTIGIVGESGSGKSTLGLALLKLIPSQGEILFEGNHINKNMSPDALRALRARMQIVFQDPFGSLSPRMSIGQIIGEGLDVHRHDLSASQREDMVVATLKDVKLDPDTRHRYPHEFSGGQRQRVSIARALVLNPSFMVLDEPTSALDVSVQAAIVDLLQELQGKHDLAYLFISHDLRVVRALSNQLIVMKDGKVVEQGAAKAVFETPQTDYTKALIAASLHLKTAQSA